MKRTPGQTMSYWVARAAKHARETAGARPIDVGRLADVYPSTITRFEQGEGIPPDIDKYLAAYAQIAGLDDPRDLWVEALRLWRQHGEAPMLTELSPAQEMERQIALGVQRAQATGRATAKGSRTTRKKQGAA